MMGEIGHTKLHLQIAHQLLPARGLVWETSYEYCTLPKEFTVRFRVGTTELIQQNPSYKLEEYDLGS